MSTRVMNIHVSQINSAADHETVNLALQFRIGISDASEISDSLNQDISLKTGLGLYKTSIQLNADIAVLVKDFAYSTYSVPTNGYAATYVSGAYGLLNLL